MAGWRRRTLLATAPALACLRHRPALADEPRYVRIATGNVTGTYYPVASAIAGLLSRPPGARPCEEAGGCGVADLILVVEASKGSVANVEAISTGSVESGFVQSDVAWGAFFGEGVFKGRPPLDSLRALASLYLESVHLVVMPDSGIDSVAGLRGRRVSLDVEGSGTLVDALLVLRAYGLSPADLEVVNASPARSLDLMAAGELDAMFLVAGYPAAIVTEATQSLHARLVPVIGQPVGRLLGEHRFLSVADIPGETYPGIDAGVPTVGVAALWVVAASLEDALVYDITRALWHPDTLARLTEEHPKGAELSLANALRGIAIPLHPGAARFYRERGLTE